MITLPLTVLTMCHVRRQLLFLILLVFSLEAGSSSVSAQRWAKSPDGQWIPVVERKEPPSMFEPDSELRLFGATLLVGLPDGIAPGISFHPGSNLVHLDLAVTGLLSLGVRAGVTLDPFDWVLAPTLTVAGGYSAWATIPSTSTQYEAFYLNIQPGLELGRRSRYRIFLRTGYTRFWVAGRSSASYRSLEATSQPSLRINFFPTVNLGLTVYFGP